MSVYEKTISKIRVLQRTAERVRKVEIKKVIKEINKEILAFNLTPNDLNFPKRGSQDALRAGKRRGPKKGSKKPKRAKKNPKAGRAISKIKTKGSSVAPKFINPETKQTWSGRGLRPRWLSEAISHGKKLEDFAI